jgi:hypothetical protein
MTSQLGIQGRSSLLAREEPPHRLVLIRSVVAVTDLQAEGRVLEHLEQLPEVRPWAG